MRMQHRIHEISMTDPSTPPTAAPADTPLLTPPEALSELAVIVAEELMDSSTDACACRGSVLIGK